MNTEDKINEELTSINQSLGTISTVSPEGKPESAGLYYVHDSALNIYFVTRSGSRKYQNLMKNPNAAFVITSEHPPKTIQLEGIASVVTDASEQASHFTQLVAKASESTIMPPVSQLVNGEMVFMKISTNWARFGSFEVLKEGDKFIETNLL